MMTSHGVAGRVLKATVIPGPAYSWQSQCTQYAYRDEPGIRLERHEIGELGAMTVVDCLLYRDEDGLLIGILNHYDGMNPLEKAGAVNVWVHPQHQRQGIATALLKDAAGRWEIDIARQSFTPDGVGWVGALMRKGLIA